MRTDGFQRILVDASYILVLPQNPLQCSLGVTNGSG